MTRRVRRKVELQGNEKAIVECDGVGVEEAGSSSVPEEEVDWTQLPHDTVIHLFSHLNYRDRASLSSTCRSWGVLGASSCLWESLDLRSYKLTSSAAASLASRCENLKKLRVRGVESADAVINLKARNLCEISGDFCRKLSDATLCVIAARHERLESIQLGPDFCYGISADAIKQVALCCPNLKKLHLSGIRDMGANAIDPLAACCKSLSDVVFSDCVAVDVTAMKNIMSLNYLSLTGTENINWDSAQDVLSSLPNLIGLDVSRTDIDPASVSALLVSSRSLRVLCTLNCTALEDGADIATTQTKGKVLLALFADIFKNVTSFFPDYTSEPRNIFMYWRKSKDVNKSLDALMTWLERTLSHTLLRIAESNLQPDFYTFWLNQGASLFLELLQSSQEDVQERAATGLATFVVIDDELATVDGGRAEAIMKAGGIRQLLHLASLSHDGIQTEATKALANLSVNSKVAKAVAEEGGIAILASLAKSMNKLVAEEAAGGLWNLSVGDEHKAAISESGGIKALVDLIFKWSSTGEGILERAAGALANLAADDKCSVEIAHAGGVHALVLLARNCKLEGVQEQAARALANMSAHGSSNDNDFAVGQEEGGLEALVKLAKSLHDGVRQEAAGALWNLSFDDSNREAIAAAGGVEALVALAQSCLDGPPGLQERAAGALWGVSVSETYSISIGHEGGISPLIALAQSNVEDVHETAAGALWNLALNRSNALRIVEEGGVPALKHLCTSSASKMARFMAALALAYMFDGRLDRTVHIGPSLEYFKNASFGVARKMALKHIDLFILTFSDPQTLAAAAASSAPAALAQITEAARIQEAGHLRCSEAELGRFIVMLRNPSSILKACASFALLQFTIPGGRHVMHHVNLLQNIGATRTLRAAAASATAPLQAKIYARIVLRNLEHYNQEEAHRLNDQ